MAQYNLATISEPVSLYFAAPYEATYGARYAMRWNTAKEAIDYATTNGITGYKPAVYVDNSWRYREQDRFNNSYLMVIWRGPLLHAIPDHYAHVSLDDAGKIAFTENPEKGMLDRQTRMLPGKYLAKFYPHLTQAQIQEWSDKHTEAFTGLAVSWASTPDEIEAVYSMPAAFSSCVQHKADHFKSPVHPCRIYGAGDLKIAYLTDGNGYLKARALVWPEKKLVGRIYGEGSLLRGALSLAGLPTRSTQYEYDDLSGARVLKIEANGYLVAPYIDGTGYVKDMGDHLVLSRDKYDIQCSTPSCDQTGFQSDYEQEEEEDDRSTCECCGDRIDEDDEYSVVGRRGWEQTWCNDCVDGRAFRCDNTEQYYTHSDYTSVEVRIQGQTWSDTYCLERSSDDITETENGEYRLNDDVVYVEVDGDTQVWSCDEFEADGFQCENGSGLFPLSESATVDGALWHRDVAAADAYLLPNGEYSMTDPDQLELEIAA